jgi:hypothetical protein
MRVLGRAAATFLWLLRHVLAGPPGSYCGSDNARYERGKIDASALAYRTAQPQLRH